MRHPGSGNFKTLLLGQLLDHLLNVRRSCSFATGSHPCRRNSNEVLKYLPNLIEKQLKRIEEIASEVAISPDGGTIAGSISSSKICENLLVSGRAGSTPINERLQQSQKFRLQEREDIQAQIFSLFYVGS